MSKLKIKSARYIISNSGDEDDADDDDDGDDNDDDDDPNELNVLENFNIMYTFYVDLKQILYITFLLLLVSETT